MDYISNTVKVTCAFCQMEIYRKNYKTHLNRKHPGKKDDSLCGFGQKKLSDFFGKGGDKPDNSDVSEIELPSDTFEPVDNMGGLGETTSQLEDAEKDTGAENLSNRRKRRFESGDSAFEEQEEGGTTPKRFQESSDGQKIDFLIEEVASLKGKIMELASAKAVEADKGDFDQEDESDVIKNLFWAKSICDIEELGFVYSEEEKKLSCRICQDAEYGEFGYDPSEETNFEDKKMGRKFVNLKKSIKRHIQSSKSHSAVLEEEAQKKEAEKKLSNKNHDAGMILGRLCLKSYIFGRPYQDYETDTFLMKVAGATVGELNHSRLFPAAFRPFVRKAVHRRQVKFLSTPLKQTGHLPPVAGSADKGTYKHRSRHFLGVITVNPGGDNFLEPISCGQPVVTDGSKGTDLASSIKSGFDGFKIISKQLESFVFDGVYFHCSVLEHLILLYDLEPGTVHASWDWMHRTGLVDKKLTKQDKFAWLRNMIDVCHQIFLTFNWGANYEKFREASAAWKLTLKNLTNFSDTRFANSKRKVFKNILLMLGPILTVLEDQVQAASQNRSGLEAANADVSFD